MRDVALSAAKRRLAQLVRRVEAGEEIGITRRGRPVARLVPPALHATVHQADQSIEVLRARRVGVSLGPLTSRELLR